MIKLQLINHQTEYELQNLVDIFNPYTNKGSDYTAISSLEEDRCSAIMMQDGVAIAKASKKVIREGLSKSELDRAIRRGLKNTLYTVLSQVFDRQMPWGILTGIRPTKIVHEYMNKTYSERSIRQILSEEYCISQEKIDLMIEVAKKEEHILNKNKPNEISLYIGIPFCPTRCVYCSFTSYSLEKKGNQVETYIDALIKEIMYVSNATKKLPIRSLYIGGGTPTSLNESQLERLLQAIHTYFDVENIEEYTVEAGRPDTITREKLRLMKQYGVNRISINPQTMNEKTLHVIGRKHSVEDIINVFEIAREEGHDNINMDLIVGLPEETSDDVAYTIEQIQKMRPESITVHTMAIKRASKLKRQKDEYQLVTAEDIEKMLHITATGAKHMNMQPYYMYRQKNMLGNFENVGYCVQGKECIYNIEIMEEKQSIIAMGAGAITKMVYQNGERLDRIPNVKSLDDYIERIDEMIERKRIGIEKYR